MSPLKYIYYKNKKYIYKIEECDKTNKNGHIKIKQYEKGRRLILTTCKNDELDKISVLLEDCDDSKVLKAVKKYVLKKSPR